MQRYYDSCVLSGTFISNFFAFTHVGNLVIVNVGSENSIVSYFSVVTILLGRSRLIFDDRMFHCY